MYNVLIRKNETGEVREYTNQFDWEDDVDLFMWTDGNYACDCNRELFFERAGGGDPDLSETICSTDRFAVLKAILLDGREIEIDSGIR